MFDFLTELAENNNKEWFDAHKAQYESAKLEVTTLFKHIYSILTELAEYLCANLLKTKKILVWDGTARGVLYKSYKFSRLSKK